jgi:hypothetical protein
MIRKGMSEESHWNSDETLVSHSFPGDNGVVVWLCCGRLCLFYVKIIYSEGTDPLNRLRFI